MTQTEWQKVRTQHQQFYLVIYTQTDAHQQFICGSGLDLGLNEKGLQEARKFARRLKQNPFKFKKFIASPELRAVQMADLLHDQVKIKIILWREFADQFMGEWEGKPILDDLDYSQPPKGETEMQFSQRVEAGTLRIFQESELCCVVTHLRVARKILHCLGLKREETERLNAGVLYVVDLPVSTGLPRLRVV